jgi:hypothetical protein
MPYYEGVVKDFLLGLTPSLPREFLRFTLDYIEVPLTYTLFGLSGWVAYKLAVRLGRNLGIMYPEVLLAPELSEVDSPVSYLEDGDDKHPRGVISIKRLTKPRLMFVFFLCVAGLYSPLIWSLIPIYLCYLHYFGVTTVNEAHYADLLAWSRGRQRNAALYHSMRQRLYRKFFEQHPFTLANARVFADTLDAAFDAKTRVLG